MSDEAKAEALAKLKAVLSSLGAVSSGEAQTATGLSSAQVKPLLATLVAEGLVVKEGKGRGTKYVRRDG